MPTSTPVPSRPGPDLNLSHVALILRNLAGRSSRGVPVAVDLHMLADRIASAAKTDEPRCLCGAELPAPRATGRHRRRCLRCSPYRTRKRRETEAT